MTELVLASGSPRRQALLRGLGYAFRILTPGTEEIPLPGETAEAFAERAARDKAREAATRIGDEAWILSGDTVVALEDRILGKPRDLTEARAMLRFLSGRVHRVITGLCFCRVRGGAVLEEQSLTVATAVEFKALSEAEIEAYTATGDPLDKAGAYGIQEGAAFMVRRIEGSYTNVVGLPLAELVDWLEPRFGPPRPAAGA